MITCLTCKNTFDTYRQLNGHKRVHGPSKGGYSVSRKIKIPRKHNCLICNKETVKKFCSKKCKDAYLWETKGVVNVLLGKKGSNILRYFKEEKMYQCSSCGISSWKGKEIKLKVCFLDNDKKNRNIENIRLQCPNCYAVR